MSGLVADTVAWFTDGAHWTGGRGVPTLLLQHLRVTAISVVAAAAIALPVGIVLGHLRRGGGIITVVGNLTRAVPTLGLLVLLTAGPLGFSYATQVVALGLFALSPLLTNTYAGLVGVDRDAVDAARGLGMGGRQVITGVELPLAVPLIATGIRTAVVQTIATATLVGFVGGGGLGVLINEGFGLAGVGRAELLAGALLVAALALLAELLLGRAQVALTPGPRRRRRAGSRPGVAAGTASTSAPEAALVGG